MASYAETDRMRPTAMDDHIECVVVLAQSVLNLAAVPQLQSRLLSQGPAKQILKLCESYLFNPNLHVQSKFDCVIRDIQLMSTFFIVRFPPICLVLHFVSISLFFFCNVAFPVCCSLKHENHRGGSLPRALPLWAWQYSQDPTSGRKSTGFFHEELNR